MKPTKRAVVDIGRKCNLNCKFCYHGHIGDLRYESFRPVRELLKEIELAAIRGNEWIDFTGGEPTIFDAMPALIHACHNRGMKACVITNALSLGEIARDCIALADEWLVSIHGKEATHDDVCQHAGARTAQLKFLNTLVASGKRFRFNTVINTTNQHGINNIIDEFELAGLMPYIWNFINFNPHHEWANDPEKTQSVIADLDAVQPQIEFAIVRLEDKGIGVNLRYYPMCKVSEAFRKNVCNDLHVVFDPYEWDYNIFPKTPEKHMEWAIAATNQTESKTAPCSHCSLQWVCGGVNTAFKNATESLGRKFEAVEPCLGVPTAGNYDFYRYRQHNKLAGVL